MRLIELTGIPGSGKTTIAPLLIRYFRKNGFVLFNKKELLLKNKNCIYKMRPISTVMKMIPTFNSPIIHSTISVLFQSCNQYSNEFLLKNWELFKLVIELIKSQNTPDNIKKLKLIRWLNLVSIYEFARLNLPKDSYLVLEEGFFHKIISFFVNIDTDIIDYNLLNIYLSGIPKINFLIDIKSDINNCVGRIEKRGRPKHLQNLSLEEIQKYLDQSAKLISISNDIIKQEGLTMISIKNNSDLFKKKYISSQLTFL